MHWLILRSGESHESDYQIHERLSSGRALNRATSCGGGSWPGQACGYKVGHSEINRQRERARAALGARYDLKAFNDTVVRGGNVPLDVLARNVDEYLRR